MTKLEHYIHKRIKHYVVTTRIQDRYLIGEVYFRKTSAIAFAKYLHHITSLMDCPAAVFLWYCHENEQYQLLSENKMIDVDRKTIVKI